MHIPKSSGTSLVAGLEAAIAPEGAAGGFDRVLFGAFDAFESFDTAERSRIYEPGALPIHPTLVCGHFAFSTLRQACPDGQLITVLREPVSRLLSHWMYWRRTTNADLGGYGAWAGHVREARRPLADFLRVPRIAAQTDNIIVRMLLWPDPRIPLDDFIDPADDGVLLTLARRRLAEFDFAAIVESADLAGRIASYLGRPLAYARQNETTDMPEGLRVPLAGELAGGVLDRLDHLCRLDLELWREAAARSLGAEAVEALRRRTTLQHAARYGAVMGA